MRDGSKADHPPLRRGRFARPVRFGGDVPRDTDGLHHPVLGSALPLSSARNLRTCIHYYLSELQRAVLSLCVSIMSLSLCVFSPFTFLRLPSSSDRTVALRGAWTSITEKVIRVLSFFGLMIHRALTKKKRVSLLSGPSTHLGLPSSYSSRLCTRSWT